MTPFFKRLILSLALALIFVPFLSNAFIVRDVQFYGLQRISPGTALSYVPLKNGQDYTSAMGDAIIRALYKTGFFSDVRIARRGNTLVITVVEQRTISLINIDGNKAVKYDDLQKVLKKMGVVVGNPFDGSKVHQLVVGLEQEYGQLGYHAVDVTADVKDAPNNTVALYIHVQEGVIAKVHSITFTGNHDFSNRQLRNQMQLTTPGLMTIFNHNDRYSEVKLQNDLQSLQTFYLNHGYLHFQVLSHDAQYTPDHKGVDLHIAVSEGAQYHVSSTELTGDLLDQRDAIQKLITIKSGDAFSRQKILDVRAAIHNFMADRGYANADVAVTSPVDEQNHTVQLIFNSIPGGRIYVHRINFYGNDRTTEMAFRQEMRQMEGAVYSQKNVDESMRRLKLLPYIDPYALQMDTSPVEGKPDEEDLNYHITEKEAGKASINAGYSDAYGFLYGASISEPNFLGTGRATSIGFNNNQVIQTYQFSYINPYATVNGVSLSVDAYYSHENYNPQFNFQSYVLNKFGFDWIYGLPINEYNTISAGFGYNNTSISQVNTAIAAPSVVNFLHGQGGGEYNLFNLITGWTFDDRDQAIFPNKGWTNSLSGTLGVPVLSSSLAYYKVGNNFAGYIPLGGGFIINLVNWVGYGNGYGKNSQDGLPFFLNYYAGGMGTVPGYEPNSLGPKDIAQGSVAAIGGNFVLTGGVHFIFPNFFHNKMRLAATFDAGNVFEVPLNAADSASPNIIENDPFKLSNLRMSAGILFEWWTPLGAPIDLSLAFPLNNTPSDQKQEFQFAFGTSI